MQMSNVKAVRQKYNRVHQTSKKSLPLQKMEAIRENHNWTQCTDQWSMGNPALSSERGWRRGKEREKVI